MGDYLDEFYFPHIFASTRSALKEYCNGGSKPSFFEPVEGYRRVTILIFLLVNSEIAFGRYIGYFGNADPLDVSQWFHLSAPLSGTSSKWNDVTSVCSSMVTGATAM